MEWQKWFNRSNPNRVRNFFLFSSVILFLSTSIIFGQTVKYDLFIFDDKWHIENPIHLFVLIEKIGWFWTQSYIPIPHTFWATIYNFWGNWGAPYHLLNSLIHFANSIIAFIIIQNLYSIISKEDKHKTTTLLLSLTGAVIFNVHPVQVQAVTWISSLKDLLAFFFGGAAMCFYLILRDQNRDFSRKRKIIIIISLTVSVICGILSKPNAAIIPVIFVFFEIFLYQKIHVKVVYYFTPVFLIAAYFVFKQAQRLPSTELLVVPKRDWTRIQIATETVQHYIQKFLLPIDLAFDYGDSPFYLLTSWSWFNTVSHIVILVLILTTGVLLFRRKLLKLTIPFTFFLIATTPNMGFICFAYQNFSTTADRYFYLGIIGPILASLFLLKFLSQKIQQKKVINFISTSIILVLMCLSFRQVRTWESSKSVLEHSVNIFPKSYPLQIALGGIYFRENKLDLAEQSFLHAHDVYPWKREPMENLTKIYIELKQYEKATKFSDLMEKYKLKNAQSRAFPKKYKDTFLTF